jgi:hypothetical protein
VEATRGDGATRLFQQAQREAQVVEAGEPRPERLVHAQQVVQVGARMPCTGRAVAVGIGRRAVVAEARVAQLEQAARREEHPVASVAGGNHAIEQVDSGGDGVEDLRRRADAHQVARQRIG